MGETIEQYRARIGTHNNIKRCPSRLKVDFSDIMLVVFQLLKTNLMLLILVQILYLSIFYVTINTECTKHLCEMACSVIQSNVMQQCSRPIVIENGK
jgi:hypothetical protein